MTTKIDSCGILPYLHNLCAGSAGFVWCCAWVAFAHDTPDDDKTISEIEKKYIRLSVGDRAKNTKVGLSRLIS